MTAGPSRSRPWRRVTRASRGAARAASIAVIGLSLLLTPAWAVFLAWLAYRLAVLAVG